MAPDPRFSVTATVVGLGENDRDGVTVLTVDVPPRAEVLLVDGSLLTQRREARAVRAAVATAVDALPDGTYFAVVLGTDRVEQSYPPQGLIAADRLSRAAAMKAVRRMKGHRGPLSYGHWLRYANALTRDFFDAHLTLLGAHEGEDPILLDAALQACRGALRCDAVGVGAGRTLAMITRELSGSLAVVESSAMGPALRAAANRPRRLSLRLSPAPGVTITSVRDETSTRLTGPEFPVVPGLQRFAVQLRFDGPLVLNGLDAVHVELVEPGRADALARATAQFFRETRTGYEQPWGGAPPDGAVGETGNYGSQPGEYPQGGYPQPGNQQPGYDEGYGQSGSPWSSSPQGGYGQSGSAWGGSPQGGYDQGYPPDVIAPQGRDPVESAGPARPSPPDPPVQEPVVNTGFAPVNGSPESPSRTLAAGGTYDFWLDISGPNPYSIETAPAPLPGFVPRDETLVVAVFGFPGEIEVDPANALRLLAPGQRARFPVRLPSPPGVYRLRCGIYWRQVLVESRVVTVHATPRAEYRADALQSTVDYRLADPAVPGPLPDFTPHTASLLLNDNGDGTHALRVLATDGGELFRSDATIGEAELATQIRLARGALRRVAWGTDQSWRAEDGYRYARPASTELLTQDLTSLARNGFRLHHLLLRALGRSTGGDVYAMTDRLRSALARPGLIQIALKESARQVLPAALLYDLPLDTSGPLRLCAEFLHHRREGLPLAGSACFRGDCAQAREPDDTVVCPGGFWGYRHALGLPVSLGRGAALPAGIAVDGAVRLSVGVYRDFQYVEEHCQALHDLLPQLDWQPRDGRDAVLRELAAGNPHLVYLYCHGGVDADVPYLRVGRAAEPAITPDNLFHSRIHWASTRPLVFLNGCRTTDLEPERAIDFVSFFVEDALACAVIGTEITVFEDLARTFAEQFVRRFLVDRAPLGEAVLSARLALLEDGNPLGLAYIPFGLPSLRVVDEVSPAV
ncbi:hypothetical protein OG943_04445 [Amycolatopsis sp. NBC_00345]|uniref:CHAT domain-containing protein n=1 Tax=Amycolatopsis sp. NBC_00345 TaxID=2975955 RepID=UPI002E275A7E